MIIIIRPCSLRSWRTVAFSLTCNHISVSKRRRLPKRISTVRLYSHRIQSGRQLTKALFPQRRKWRWRDHVRSATRPTLRVPRGARLPPLPGTTPPTLGGGCPRAARALRLPHPRARPRAHPAISWRTSTSMISKRTTTNIGLPSRPIKGLFDP